MPPVRAACNRSFPASHHSGTRPTAAVRWIVLHSTEGGTARSVALFFASPTATGSAHLTVDDVSCYRSLRNDQVPHAAPGANTFGFHIEQCGFARWNRTTWLRHAGTLRRAAYKTALHCRVFGIPVRFVNAAGLDAGTAGITTHVECSRAFGGDHTDPGDGWPRAIFMGLVRTYRAELAARDFVARRR